MVTACLRLRHDANVRTASCWLPGMATTGASEGDAAALAISLAALRVGWRGAALQLEVIFGALTVVAKRLLYWQARLLDLEFCACILLLLGPSPAWGARCIIARDCSPVIF